MDEHALSGQLSVKRPRRAFAFRPVAAVASSLAGALAFVVVYYLLFSFIPAVHGDGLTGFHPLGSSNSFDLPQFFGTILDPPYQTVLSYWIGLAVLIGILTGTGFGYAIALSWAMNDSNPALETGFGLSLSFVLGMIIWLGVGFEPADMRGAFPDTGFFMLGWSGWATFSLLVSCLAYARTIGRIYNWTKYAFKPG